MQLLARSTPRRKRSSWRRFWRYNFLGRVLLFALSSGASGFFVGAFVGRANWLSGHQFAEPIEKVVMFCACASAVLMAILGFLVGLILFALVGTNSWRWSASRKHRFARQLKMRFYLPVAGSLLVIPAFAGLIRVGWRGKFLSSAFDVGTVLTLTQMAVLPMVAGLFTCLLVRSSKTKPSRRQMPIPTERLLPLS